MEKSKFEEIFFDVLLAIETLVVIAVFVFSIKII